MAITDYKRLSTILKRYKIEDKLRYAEEYSREIMKPDVQGNPSKIRKNLLPWELECFVMLSIKAKEWKCDNLDTPGFLRIMTVIRNAMHPKLQLKVGSEQFIKWLMMMLSATQFDYEESYWHKFFRFSFYFSYVSEKVNMPEEFRKKFGVEYQCILSFSWALWVLYITDVKSVDIYKRELIEKYPEAVALLSIDRDDYIAELDKITSDPYDYIYCLRPSYSFPFVKYKEEIFLPLPHLLVRAATSSLMFRLTDGNDRLREIVGHEVLEAYLFHILSTYPEFKNQVKQEIVYSKGKLQNQRSADVMALIGDQVICFDSKSFSPKIALRTFSDEACSSEIQRLGKAVKQMYEQIHNKYGIEYNPFDIAINEDKSNIWGLIIVSENPFIKQSDIYFEAAKQLKVPLSEDEYNWLQGHVGIVSLSSLEYQVFSCNDILSIVRQNSISQNFNDYWFAGMKAKRESEEIKLFKKHQSELSVQMLISLDCITHDQSSM